MARAKISLIRGDGILHPVTLGALALLIVNDHVLKQALPGVVTGKLSDVAGLAFFPTLIVGVLEVLRIVARASVPALWSAVIATGIIFALTKTWQPANDAYAVVVGALQWPFRALLWGQTELVRVSLVRDPTDLVALPALLVPMWLGLRRARA